MKAGTNESLMKARKQEMSFGSEDQEIGLVSCVPGFLRDSSE